MEHKPFKCKQARFKVKKTYMDGSKVVTFPRSITYNGGTIIDGEWYSGYEVPMPKVPAGFELVTLGIGSQLNARPPYSTMLLRKKERI